MRDSNNFFKNADGKGMIMQSLDVLDYSIIHLSTYERSNKKYMRQLWKDKEERKAEWSKIGPVVQAAKILETKNKNKVICCLIHLSILSMHLMYLIYPSYHISYLPLRSLTIYPRLNGQWW